MTRSLLFLALMGSVCALVSAQAPVVPLTAAERLQLLQVNRSLIEDLIESGLRISKKNAPLDLAEESLKATQRLARELREALGTDNADRTAEISDLLGQLVSEAFLPNLVDARRTIPSGSPDFLRYKKVHKEAFEQVSPLAATIPKEGVNWGGTRVQSSRSKLETVLATIGSPPSDATD